MQKIFHKNFCYNERGCKNYGEEKSEKESAEEKIQKESGEKEKEIVYKVFFINKNRNGFTASIFIIQINCPAYPFFSPLGQIF